MRPQVSSQVALNLHIKDPWLRNKIDDILQATVIACAHNQLSILIRLSP